MSTGSSKLPKGEWSNSQGKPSYAECMQYVHACIGKSSTWGGGIDGTAGCAGANVDSDRQRLQRLGGPAQAEGTQPRQYKPLATNQRGSEMQHEETAGGTRYDIGGSPVAAVHPWCLPW